MSKRDEKPPAEKFSHAAVKYEDPSRHGDRRCSGCTHFIAGTPSRCEGVQSPIAPGAFCQRFDESLKGDLFGLFP